MKRDERNNRTVNTHRSHRMSHVNRATAGLRSVLYGGVDLRTDQDSRIAIFERAKSENLKRRLGRGAAL